MTYVLEIHAFVVLEDDKVLDSNLFSEINARIIESHGEKARLTKKLVRQYYFNTVCIS